MFSNGGKITLSVLIIWILATFGCDFLTNSDFAESGKKSEPAVIPGTGIPGSQTANNGTATNVGWENEHRTPSSRTPVAFNRGAEHLAIGTFNIEVFGVEKMSKPNVVNVLVDIARQFDVLAIQELRALDQSIVPQFVELINSNGSMYSYVVGPRQGNSISKEQYVYIFDTQRVELVEPIGLVPDPQNLIQREPLVANFRALGPQPHEAFTFTLMNVHTTPSVVKSELNILPAMLQYVRATNIREDDVILLGDFNASPRDMGGLANVQGIYAVLSPEFATNTNRDRHYDNILIDQYQTNEFTGSSGVLDLMSHYNLTLDQAHLVSDHMPVWALFSIYETPPSAVANQPGTFR